MYDNFISPKEVVRLVSDGILPILDEQSTFGFTGRINVLLKENNQHIGVVWQKNGDLVHAEYHGIKGKRALFNLVFDDIDKRKDLKFIVEPELIPNEALNFHYTYSEFHKKMEMRFKQYKEFKKYRPPDNLNLYVNAKFMEDIHGYSIGPEEFDVLCLVIDYSKVLDIFKNSMLYDYQITRALVSLRRKNALIVKKPAEKPAG